MFLPDLVAVIVITICIILVCLSVTAVCSQHMCQNCWKLLVYFIAFIDLKGCVWGLMFINLHIFHINV